VLVTSSVWLGGDSDRVAPAHGALPSGVHWVDSLLFVAVGHSALSTPPVLSTWPLSKSWSGAPSIVRSTSGMTPLWVQLKAQFAPPGPMSEVSKMPPFGHPVAPAPPMSLRMTCAPVGMPTSCGHESNVQVSRRSTTELSVTAEGLLLTMRIAPLSHGDAPQLLPKKPETPGLPAQGVGKFVGMGRAESA
jgi:hypothetical protein